MDGEAGIPKDCPRVYRIVFSSFFETVLHLGNIHYGIIGFVGIGSRLGIHFDRKPLFYTMNSIGMHTCLMKMYGFLEEFIDFQ